MFVTHSQGGGLGWMTALKSGNVRAIVSYEPGSGFLFPTGEVPEALLGRNADLFGQTCLFAFSQVNLQFIRQLDL